MPDDSYKGVKVTNRYFSGHKNVILPTLIKSIEQIIRADRYVVEAYIGVASGKDYWDALTSRIDEKKVEHGVNCMDLIYMSTSEDYTRSLEDQLIEHFKKERGDVRFWNDKAGGGGRKGSGPAFCLYLATTKKEGALV